MSTSPAATHPTDLLLDALKRAGSPVCVGLDPVLERLPEPLKPQDATNASAAYAIAAFSCAVLHAVRGTVGAVKVQSACYERFGAEGAAALDCVCREARELGFVVIFDAKRADIGVSTEHYAAASRALDAQFTTCSPYLGADGIEPFLAHGQGAFALVRTSNLSGDLLQSLALADGRTVAEAVADLVAALGAKHLGASGFSSLGAVVGATKRDDAVRLRARMPHAMFLVPGYGTQGGTADDVRACFREDGRGAVVNASRSILYPRRAGGQSFEDAIREAACTFRDEVAAVVRPLETACG